MDRAGRFVEPPDRREYNPLMDLPGGFSRFAAPPKSFNRSELVRALSGGNLTTGVTVPQWSGREWSCYTRTYSNRWKAENTKGEQSRQWRKKTKLLP